MKPSHEEDEMEMNEADILPPSSLFDGPPYVVGDSTPEGFVDVIDPLIPIRLEFEYQGRRSSECFLYDVTKPLVSTWEIAWRICQDQGLPPIFVPRVEKEMENQIAIFGPTTHIVVAKAGVRCLLTIVAPVGSYVYRDQIEWDLANPPDFVIHLARQIAFEQFGYAYEKFVVGIELAIRCRASEMKSRFLHKKIRPMKDRAKTLKSVYDPETGEFVKKEFDKLRRSGPESHNFTPVFEPIIDNAHYAEAFKFRIRAAAWQPALPILSLEELEADPGSLDRTFAPLPGQHISKAAGALFSGKRQSTFPMKKEDVGPDAEDDDDDMSHDVNDGDVDDDVDDEMEEERQHSSKVDGDEDDERIFAPFRVYRKKFEKFWSKHPQWPEPKALSRFQEMLEIQHGHPTF